VSRAARNRLQSPPPLNVTRIPRIVPRGSQTVFPERAGTALLQAGFWLGIASLVHRPNAEQGNMLSPVFRIAHVIYSHMETKLIILETHLNLFPCLSSMQ
jgi:hypothetical protein